MRWSRNNFEQFGVDPVSQYITVARFGGGPGRNAGLLFDEVFNFDASDWFGLAARSYLVLLLNQSKFPGSLGHPLAD